MSAGIMNRKVRFEREVLASDGAGGQTSTWTTLFEAWARLMDDPGAERAVDGRIEAAAREQLRIYWCAAVAGLTTADRAVLVTEGTLYQVRGITNRDGRNQFADIAVERGVGL